MILLIVQVVKQIFTNEIPPGKASHVRRVL